MIHNIGDLSAKLQLSPKMPVVFIGHGSPMNAIELNNFTCQWESVGGTLPKPQAFVVISAHWMTNGTHVTSAPRQPLIYDMYGFPNELYEFKYDASGDPALAAKIVKALHKFESALDSGWGLDHGTWSVLSHVAPKADVPVLQISLDATAGLNKQADIFRDLRHLRNKGVLFIGSGNIVHNLGMLDFSDKPYDWSIEFDEYASQKILDRDTKSLIDTSRVKSASQLAIPTDEHYRPMLAAMILSEGDKNLEFFSEGIVLGSVSMRSFISY